MSVIVYTHIKKQTPLINFKLKGWKENKYNLSKEDLFEIADLVNCLDMLLEKCDITNESKIPIK